MADRPFLDEAIRIQRVRGGLDDFPDEKIADLTGTQLLELRLAVDSLGRAIVADVPRPLRRLVRRLLRA